MVRAGGIGSELIKTLALSEFEEIHIQLQVKGNENLRRNLLRRKTKQLANSCRLLILVLPRLLPQQTHMYLAPEYATSGMLTEKSDVYSFGVVLLELITGRRLIDPNNVYGDNSFVDWARPLLLRAIGENNFEVLVDKRLNNEYDIEEMCRMVETAAACVCHAAHRRPRMSQVERALEGTDSPNNKYSNPTYDSGTYPSGSEHQGNGEGEIIKEQVSCS